MRQTARLSVVSVLVLLTAAKAQAQKQVVRVAAAADLKFALSEVASAYENQAGVKIETTYGSSGNLFSQLQNGAPFDLFFSADIEYPRKLEAAGLAEPGTIYMYAVGRIAIWMPADAKVDVSKHGWDALLDPSVQKIAIANPEHAPYGRAAITALRKSGIYDRVKAKLVFGENISQAAQFVQSGSAQAGILAMSLALSPAMRDGNRWEIPQQDYEPIEQRAAVLKNAVNKKAALAFLEYVKSEAGKRTLEKYGFTALRIAADPAGKP
jgi:molybdate transport system substrate-binding protein